MWNVDLGDKFESYLCLENSQIRNRLLESEEPPGRE